MSRPPNILLTIADDQRGTALGCTGTESVITPSLDRLAQRGTRFSQAQHFGSPHGAICAPSRAMLHTGMPYFQLPDELVCGHSDGNEVPLPESLGGKLQEAGYNAFGTGKWHNGERFFNASFSSGQNIFFGGMADHWFTPVHDHDPSGKYPSEKQRNADGFSTEVFAQSAIDFIRSQKDNDQPFFCYCAFTAPHDPRTPPDHWRARYDPRDIELTPNMITSPRTGDTPSGVYPLSDNGALSIRDELLLGTPRDVSEIKRSIAEYYAMISDMDEWIGKIHEALEEIGAFDNTIVIHTADHGLAVGQHGFMGKQNSYQHSLHVPLLMSGPGIPQNNVVDGLCYQHDLHPTIEALAGLPAKSETFHSLQPMLEGKTGRSHLANAFSDTQRSIRDERYKLIEYHIEDQRRTEMFDLQEDPWEMKDLSANNELQTIRESLQKELHSWQQKHGDQDWKANAV
ncbi:sulfatase-like hydrolase/transferase [Rubellicoccus peritrichatus]|uniref:Sulfatase-like hydrolase/transferase n=1 Tax=Rubellicoccus peritrichatus TaxID=3080537 RepID=A0AAQ3QPR8_9BACT|nr:sulfatase-like hydrolase/transferase [Puniceicoccus sp. CR14]WOO39368.1 sulfatase-like hydrolase/transferase [Puniceicoccus sp. CR14]